MEQSSNRYADCAITAPDYYFKIIREENTVLYVTAYPDSKDDCKS